jgi:transposase
MGKKNARNYDNEFKNNAIRLCLRSGRQINEIALELGIPKDTLGGWVAKYKKHGEHAFPGKGHLRPEDAEIAKLRRELAIVREERDILKKAVGIFSVQQK